MIKKLSKHGNSHAIVIDKPILQVLNITENTSLKVTVQNNKIIIEAIEQNEPISKIATVSDDSKFQKAYENIIKKYGNALEKLAK